MSSLKDKFKMALKSAKTVTSNVLEGKEFTVSDEVFKARMQACKACPKFLKATEQCGECGCFLAVKGRLAGMECPLDKWSK
jgi:hypothetical protein